MYRTDPHFDKRMKLVKEALKQDRSKEEIQQDMREAGIIGRDGKLRKPYDKMYDPSEK